MDINERLIKVSGSLPIMESLNMDQEVTLEVIGSVVKIEDKSNQDGTQDKIYTIKIEQLNQLNV